MKPMRIVFFGTPDFAAHSLEKVIQAGYEVVVVVTAPDKPAGRGMKIQSSAVKQTADAHGIPVLQPTNLKDAAFQETLKAYNLDLGIVIAFRMLPEAVWRMPQMGTFNLHASLLPQYRGAAPIHHAIINGERITGVSTFFLKHEIDTGDLLLQEQVTIDSTTTTGELYKTLMELGGSLVLKTLQRIEKGELQGIPQTYSDTLRTAPKLSRAFCEVYTHMTCEALRNKVRGLNPSPGAWIQSPYGVLKLYRVVQADAQRNNNNLYIEDKKLFLPCSDGVLEILELQPEGKPRMQAIDFVNGIANKRE
jgi:methionyl-tRNA formyltransferase